MDFNFTNSERINSAYKKFYEKHGYIPKMFNSYNCAEITDIAPTITARCGIQNTSGEVLILEIVEE